MIQSVTCNKCRSVNDFHIIQKGIHDTAYCNVCGSYIKNIPQGKPLVFMFGKFKGTPLEDMKSVEQINYLKWVLTSDMKDNIKSKVKDFLNEVESDIKKS